MIQVTKLRTFTYGASIRTVYALSQPLTDRAFPLRWHVVEIVQLWEQAPEHRCYFLESYRDGTVMGFTPICPADLAEIGASIQRAN